MSQAAIVVDEKDNVATALRELEQGESISVEIGGRVADVTVLTPIPFGHKIALADIGAGQPIIKYGETVGLATEGIGKGQHTHVQNVEEPKGRSDQA